MILIRKAIVALIAIALAIPAFAQGIEFEHGSWSEVLAKAKASNKPIFVDVYTSWCGPCKQMAKNIFPQKEVGDKYNASFICYKIDAEKGEGVELAKTYNVTSYPNLLYLKPDGELIYRVTGSRVAYEFIAEADVALQKAGIGKQQKSLADYQKEYDNGNRNPDFLVDYMKQRYMAKLPNVTLADTLFKYLPAEKRLSPPYNELLVFNAADFFSPLYTFITDNYKQVEQAADSSMRPMLRTKIRGAADKVAYTYKGKLDPSIPERIAKVYTNIFEGLAVSKDEPLYLMLANYYTSALDTTGYLNNATKYAKQILLKQTKESLTDSARRMHNESLQLLQAGEIDSSYYLAERGRSEAILMLSAFRSANIAAGITERAKDKEQQQLALKLSTHAISLDASPNNMAAYALVLGNNRKQKEAKKIAQKALDDATAKNDRNLPEIKKRYEAVMNVK